MTINDEIFAIANQLANQGSKPSVALIKTKLTERVPLPKIISALKLWQHDPSFIEVTKKEKKIENKTSEQKVGLELSEQIKEAVEPLKQEIKELKVMIQQLIKQS